MDALKNGNDAGGGHRRSAMGRYGQLDAAAKYIDPRTDEEIHTVDNVFPVHE